MPGNEGDVSVPRLEQGRRHSQTRVRQGDGQTTLRRSCGWMRGADCGGLCKALADLGLEMPSETLDYLWQILDTNQDGKVLSVLSPCSQNPVGLFPRTPLLPLTSERSLAVLVNLTSSRFHQIKFGEYIDLFENIRTQPRKLPPTAAVRQASNPITGLRIPNYIAIRAAMSGRVLNVSFPKLLLLLMRILL